MVIGAQTENMQGHAVLFASDNLTEWRFLGPITGAGFNGLDDFGYMWECPDLFSLQGSDVLIVSPQGLRPMVFVIRTYTNQVILSDVSIITSLN